MSSYAYKMAPLYKPKLWGGRNFQRLFGRVLPPGEAVGEAWELADLEEGQSSVANGRRTGMTLHQLVEAEGEALLGPTPTLPNGRFPLLLKLLDAQDTLSLQVHPDDRTAREIPGAASKTECWYILESRGGFIYKGLKPGVTARQFRHALKGDNVIDLLQRFEVKAGDFHHLPAGTLHALGAGVVLAEVQTPSDTTFRASDWGRGREIHVEEAMRSIHFEHAGPDAQGAAGECLVRSESFHVFLRSRPPGTHPLASGRCSAWMALSGQGQIRSDHTDGVVDFGPGDTLLLPADLTDPTVTIYEPATWLEMLLPPF